MKPHLLMIFWIILYLIIIVFLDLKYQLLRNTSTAKKKSYSYSRMQLAWWIGLVLCAFIAVIFSNNNPGLDIPNIPNGILIVLGLSCGTSAAAKLTDVSDQLNNPLNRHQNNEGTNLILDILSDKDGPSIHRLQSVLFNIIFGIWFFLNVWNHGSIPDIDPNALVLLGLSSGTYAALKTTENKIPQPVG